MIHFIKRKGGRTRILSFIEKNMVIGSLADQSFLYNYWLFTRAKKIFVKDIVFAISKLPKSLLPSASRWRTEGVSSNNKNSPKM